MAQRAFTVFLAIFSLATLCLACQREEKFPALGLQIASPIDIAVSDNDEYFYVLNSDFDRT